MSRATDEVPFIKESHNVGKSFLFSAAWREIAACHYQAQGTLGTVIFRAAGGEITHTHILLISPRHTHAHTHSPFVALRSTFWQHDSVKIKQSNE